MTIILDPGHGLSNKRAGVFDSGAVSGQFREADIVMDWANEIRAFLRCAGHKVIRTRINNSDPAPIGERASIAENFGGDVMLSLHCNAFNGTANGTETFYRGAHNKNTAEAINAAVVDALGTVNRGVKTENQSQHARLAVMNFQPCFLLEIGFIDHVGDRQKMTDPLLRAQACAAVAEILVKN
jgi:N-acetylmuramoyl-L-alanine amidase